MARIRKEELDRLAGEVLPERTVLGIIGLHGQGSTTIGSACQGSVSSGGQAGMLDRAAAAVTGAAAQPSGASLQCFPAAVVNNY
jgi:hypothetical protein